MARKKAPTALRRQRERHGVDEEYLAPEDLGRFHGD